MGPACEVTFSLGDADPLDVIDRVLVSVAGRIERTRKGRAWAIWIDGRPFHAAASEESGTLSLSAGCNGAEDYETLRSLASRFAEALGGVSTDPVK